MSNPSKNELLYNLRGAIENRSISSIITISKLLSKQYGREETHKMIVKDLLHMSKEDLVWFGQQADLLQQPPSNNYGSGSFFK